MDNKPERSSDAPASDGPIRGGRPVEPTPQDGSRHPTPEAEDRCEEVRDGGGRPDENRD